MKNLKEKLNQMEKNAVRFIKYGLQAVLPAYIFMLVYIQFGMTKQRGVDSYLSFLAAREMAMYLILSFLLVICGGLFIDIAIKKEKEQNIQ